MLSKYAAPVAALVASAAAQSSCSFSATTITDAGDASALAQCTAISGDVIYATGAAAPTLSLGEIQSIDGKLTYQQDNTVSLITAPSLTTVSGAITFNNLTQLGDIELSALQKSGDVTLQNLGGLQKVTTGTQYNSAGVVMISNTQLTTLGGFGNLSMVDSVAISGNPLLSDITMNIGSVKSINIGSNEEANNGLNVAFNNLTTANMITVENATQVGFDSLKTVTGSLSLIFNNFQTFSAPNLSYAGGISLISNNQLTNISMPVLTTLNGTNGTFYISNNTNLKTIGGFDMLTECDHDVVFNGVFENVTSISQLKQVSGAFMVSSTADIQNTVCKTISGLKSSQVIRGKATCSGSSKSAASNAGGSGTSSDGSSSSSSAAAGNLQIPALPSLSAGLGAFLLQFLLSF